MAANPIALLVQGPNHRYGRLGLPQNPPQNPATPANVIEAIRLASHALKYRDDGAPPTSDEYVSDEAVAACFHYQKAVLESAAGVAGAPHWFQQWNQASFQPLVNDVNTLKNDMRDVKDNMTTLLIRDGKGCNARRNVDDSGPFYEIPFQDGRNPWGLSVDIPGHLNLVLPRLDTQASIDNLTLAQSYGYYAGYYPNVPVLDTGSNTLQDRKFAIARAIGHAA